MKPARERTPFNNPHTTVTPRRVSTADMAEMLRDGASRAEVAEAFGMSRHSVKDRLTDGGWHTTTGQPTSQVRAVVTPLTREPDLSWQADGDCTRDDPERWFPEVESKSRAAKKICAGCPVVETCRDYALGMKTNPYGTWGGTTRRERAAIRRAMAEEEAS